MDGQVLAARKPGFGEWAEEAEAIDVNDMGETC